MIIDFHVHIFPDDIAPRAIPKLAQGAGISAFLTGTKQHLLCSLDWAGIDKVVIQPVATKAEQVQSINRWLAQIRSERLDAFAAFFPSSATWEQDLEEIVKLGFRGVKLHPDYQRFFVDAKELFPIYKQIFEQGLFVLFHAGVDIGLPPPVHCTPRRLRRVVEQFPAGQIIAAHLGGWQMWDQVEKQLLGLPLFLDTSFSLPYLGKERAQELIQAHGFRNVLFGTDSPWAPQLSSLEQLRNLKLEPEKIEAILGGNAKRILGG